MLCVSHVVCVYEYSHAYSDHNTYRCVHAYTNKDWIWVLSTPHNFQTFCYAYVCTLANTKNLCTYRLTCIHAHIKAYICTRTNARTDKYTYTYIRTHVNEGLIRMLSSKRTSALRTYTSSLLLIGAFTLFTSRSWSRSRYIYYVVCDKHSIHPKTNLWLRLCTCAHEHDELNSY